jgi:DNA-binding NtrC family response regulator
MKMQVVIAPANAPIPVASLRELDQRLVEQTLAEYGGNVSREARALGVSRGLVYRHLNRLRPTRQTVAAL